MDIAITSGPSTQYVEKRLNVFERYLAVWVALCMIVGVLVEVPVMLSVCALCNRTRIWFPVEQPA
jgi:ACR3 family arsenite efflux pump ArsB